MLWSIYDEDNDKFLKTKFSASLDEAIVALIEAGRENEENTEFLQFYDWQKRREWGIRLYPATRDALVEIETKESRSFLTYGKDVLLDEDKERDPPRKGIYNNN